jgi:hypothetical protein
LLNPEPLNTLIYRCVETMIDADSRSKGVSNIFGQGPGVTRASVRKVWQRHSEVLSWIFHYVSGL